MILRDTNGIAETLEMINLSLAEKFDRVAHIGIIHKTENVIIRCARFLLCCNRMSATNFQSTQASQRMHTAKSIILIFMNKMMACAED